MPKAFTSSEKEIIQQRLLDQGFRLFSAYGLKKTNIEEIARAAGISKGAFYLFYTTKEELFFDVVEVAEKQFRVEVLAELELPGPTPRARLFAALKKAFSLWKMIPILQMFSRSDYDLLFQHIPHEKVVEHLNADQTFIKELMTRARLTGIPIRAGEDEISGLLYAVFLTSLHEEDRIIPNFTVTTDILIELTAAYCLGEVTTHPIHSPANTEGSSEKEK
jgi:AcrR family transcriptional regulator